MINDKFIDSLPDDPVEAGVIICRLVVGTYESAQPEYYSNPLLPIYDEFLTALALLQTIVERLDLAFRPPKLSSNRETNLEDIYNYARMVAEVLEKEFADLSVKAATEKYSARFGGKFVYEFSTGDLNKIQSLLNELRDRITGSELFEEDHKSRLLKKLEALQSELHKRMSNLDKFWGFVGEAGIALGKFGKDAKPFVDLIREIIHIVWRTQSRAEELPTDTPLQLLGSDEEKP